MKDETRPILHGLHILCKMMNPRLGLLRVPWPDSPAEWWKEWTRWYILRLPLGPVVTSKCPSQGTLLQGQAEVDQPEEDQQVGQLQQEEVAVVERLPTIEGKQTLRTLTLCYRGDVGSVKGLTVTWGGKQRRVVYMVCAILILFFNFWYILIQNVCFKTYWLCVVCLFLFFCNVHLLWIKP